MVLDIDRRNFSTELSMCPQILEPDCYSSLEFPGTIPQLEVFVSRSFAFYSQNTFLPDTAALRRLCHQQLLLFPWMLTSDSEQEADHLSFPCDVAPQLPQEGTANPDPNAMAVVDLSMVMAHDGGSRLPASRSRDDEQTDLTESRLVTAIRTHKLYQIVGSSTNTPASYHVDAAHSELLNDTSSNSASTAKSTRGRSAAEQSPAFNIIVTRANDSGCASRTVAASRPTTSFERLTTDRHTSTTHQVHQHPQIQGPFSSEQLQASIKAAVASIGPLPAQNQEQSSSDSASHQDYNEEDTELSSPSNMSVDNLVPSKKPRRKRSPQAKLGQSNGRWSQQEHQAFLEGLKECGREWKQVAMRIPTRTSAQIRSHAQKYFAKLERDQETMVLPDVISLHNAEASATATVPVSEGQALTPAVQRNVERILSNPTAVQREVETTLDALRERYRQLQLRLEHRQQRRRVGRGTNPSNQHHISDHEHPPSSSSSMRCMSSLPRKRFLESYVDTNRVVEPSYQHVDDHSSVCSNVSASVASMANDELIALHVLGGALPQGESCQDLPRLAGARTPPCSDDSIASSHESAHNERCDDPTNIMASLTIHIPDTTYAQANPANSDYETAPSAQAPPKRAKPSTP